MKNLDVWRFVLKNWDCYLNFSLPQFIYVLPYFNQVGFFDAIFVIGVTCLKILSNAGPLAGKPLVDALQTYVNMELSLILKSFLLHVDMVSIEGKKLKDF